MDCIFCDKPVIKNSLEHIVPESLGNKYYTISNKVCSDCNNTFSNFEEKAISKSYLGFLRLSNGVKTKKGKPGTAVIDKMKIKGNNYFQKNVARFDDIPEEFIESVHPETGEMILTFPDFDKSEMPAAKLLLKIAFESLYKSLPKVWAKHNFDALKDYLCNRSNRDWPFITSHKMPYEFQDIVKYKEKHELKKILCTLKYLELSDDAVLFDFGYDDFHLTINILSRTFDWSDIYFKTDSSASLYPKHLVKKIKRDM